MVVGKQPTTGCFERNNFVPQLPQHVQIFRRQRVRSRMIACTLRRALGQQLPHCRNLQHGLASSVVRHGLGLRSGLGGPSAIILCAIRGGVIGHD